MALIGVDWRLRRGDAAGLAALAAEGLDRRWLPGERRQSPLRGTV
jgi:hypothetical protein